MTSRRNAQPIVRTGRTRLTARSVIASTLLGLNPPQLRTAALIAGAELLGVSPGTARVAVSRMVADGELEPTDDGYRLAGRLLERQARQDLSRAGAPDGWDGSWATAIVPAHARPAAERNELRRTMALLRHGELRDGVWMRPANLPQGVLPDLELHAAQQTVVVEGRLASDPVGLTGRLWDLPAWATTAGQLLLEIEPLHHRLAAADASALAPSFETAAAALRHLQADPLLPTELLPASWPGADLRAAQAAFEATFRSQLRAWHLARA